MRTLNQFGNAKGLLRFAAALRESLIEERFPLCKRGTEGDLQCLREQVDRTAPSRSLSPSVALRRMGMRHTALARDTPQQALEQGAELVPCFGPTSPVVPPEQRLHQLEDCGVNDKVAGGSWHRWRVPRATRR